MESSLIQRTPHKHIKPSTPTPPSLRHHNLCLNSQIETEYMQFVFFYPNNHHHHLQPPEPTTTTRVLENALSKTLSYYYPFAGRLRDNMYIDCNDAGACLSETRINSSMSDFFGVKEKLSRRAIGVPPSMVSDEYMKNDPSLLLIQLTYFHCGGMALCICMSHKLGDLSTLFTFYHDWASMVIMDGNQTNHVPTPRFLGPSLFEPFQDPNLVKEVKIKPIFNPLTHLFFSNTKLEELKNKVINSTSCNNSNSRGVEVEKPTRVEVVTALVYKCALEASKKVFGKFKPAGIVFTINLRPLIVPPLPANAVGNLSVGLIIPTVNEEDITLEKLVKKIRDKKEKVKDSYKNGKNPSRELVMEQMNMMSSDKLDLYVCSSWCRHPFYEVDFGRGKPETAYIPDYAGGKNVFMLRDGKDGDGIEVLASLEVEEIHEFVNNQELLAFASIE